MGFAEMAVAIVLVVTIGRVLRERYRSQRRLPGKSDITAEQDNMRLQSEVARLNDRIRVLERLATDPAKRLADEIDSLKDK
jgi:sensor domain CHASE-containing protein